MESAWSNGTCETTPRHIWMHEVISAAGVTVEEAKPFRDKLLLWYRSGESVALAAPGLNFAVRQRAIEIQKDRVEGIETLRAAYRASILKK